MPILSVENIKTFLYIRKYPENAKVNPTNHINVLKETPKCHLLKVILFRSVSAIRKTFIIKVFIKLQMFRHENWFSK